LIIFYQNQVHFTIYNLIGIASASRARATIAVGLSSGSCDQDLFISAIIDGEQNAGISGRAPCCVTLNATSTWFTPSNGHSPVNSGVTTIYCSNLASSSSTLSKLYRVRITRPIIRHSNRKIIPINLIKVQYCNVKFYQDKRFLKILLISCLVLA